VPAPAAAPNGYSGTPLPQKLGVREGSLVLLDGAPDGFELAPLPEGVRVHRRASSPPYDVAVLFTTTHRRLDVRWAALHERVTTAASTSRSAPSTRPGRDSPSSYAAPTADQQVEGAGTFKDTR
jgi:hypothetical protein